MTTPEIRVTAYRYVWDHGLMQWYGTLDWLLEIGFRAAGVARGQGIPELKVPEGDFQVHIWPEWVWAQVIISVQTSPASRRPPKWEKPTEVEVHHEQPMTREQTVQELVAGAKRARALTENWMPGPWDEPPPGPYPYSGPEYGNEQDEVTPPWCPLPQGDQALRDIGY